MNTVGHRAKRWLWWRWMRQLAKWRMAGKCDDRRIFAEHLRYRDELRERLSGVTTYMTGKPR